jgi:hypothetical protein
LVVRGVVWKIQRVDGVDTTTDNARQTSRDDFICLLFLDTCSMCGIKAGEGVHLPATEHVPTFKLWEGPTEISPVPTSSSLPDFQ